MLNAGMHIFIVLGIAATIALMLLTYLAYGVYSAWKLIAGVPWLVWLTLDDVVAMGHSRYWSEIVLPMFYRGGSIFIGSRLQVRPRNDLEDPVRETISRLGFQRYTVRYYEFKFTSQSSGGRGKWRKSRVEILQPTPIYGRRRVNR